MKFNLTLHFSYHIIKCTVKYIQFIYLAKYIVKKIIKSALYFLSYNSIIQCNTSNFMKKDDENDSDQEQGFYKPQIKVIEPSQQSPLVAVENQKLQANDLICHSRPTDMVPRVLTTSPQLHQNLKAIDKQGDVEQQELIPISFQKSKNCRYLSLKQKYQNNQLYRLLYSKLQQPTDFNSRKIFEQSYIFSLNHTADYNPADYQAIHPEKQQKGIFDSKFQSGNLLYAYHCRESKINEYDLIMQNDTNTRGYNKWFFFSYKNQNRKSAKFNIVNFIKKHQLFKDGVRPVGLSKIDQYKGWHSVGKNIEYQKSYVNRQVTSNSLSHRHYYTLSFTIDFSQENDTYFFALNYPYTYSKMIYFLHQLTSKTPKNIIIDKHTLCHSISNNALPALRIRHRNYVEGGKKILVMGRQHPGQTVGSFVLQGFLKNIINEEKLLKNFQLIVIPMINPDGVIYGNFRTNLAGFDLNRQWNQSDRWMHPQIYAIQKYLQSLQNLDFVIDFHGHSKKYNSFIFACNGEQSSPFRVFPYLFSTLSSYFSIKNCTFSVTADKQKTARIRLFRQLNKIQIFTFETSFFGYENQVGKKYRWKIHHLIEIGAKTVQSLKFYLLKRKEIQQIQKQVKYKQYLFQQWNRENKQNLQSQSNPSEDQLSEVERKQKVILTKESKHSSKVKLKKKSFKQQKQLVFSNSKQKNVNASDKSSSPFSIIKDQQSSALTIIRRKIQSQKATPLKDIKIKPKKIQKKTSITPPQSPKIEKKIIIETNLYKQITKQQKQRVIITSKSERKAQNQFQKTSVTSNLFNKPNYFYQLQQRLLKLQNNNKNKHNKSQSLEVHSVKYDKTKLKKENAINILRKIVSSQEDQRIESKMQSLKRQRERFYKIRENRIINTSARLNETQFKKNLEEEINNRTQALKNCQIKMRQITLDENNNLNFQLQYLDRNFESRDQKFPSLRIQRKT